MEEVWNFRVEPPVKYKKKLKETECKYPCRECVICKNKKVCCSCDWNNGYHACVYWDRDKKEAQ
jgi:hypothetical protein